MISHSQELNKFGVAFPLFACDCQGDSGNGLRLFQSLRSTASEDSTFAVIKDYLDNASSLLCDRVVISSEHLAYLDDSEIQHLTKILDEMLCNGMIASVEFAYAKRNRDSLMISLYKHRVLRMGYSRPYGEFSIETAEEVDRLINISTVIGKACLVRNGFKYFELIYSSKTGEEMFNVLTGHRYKISVPETRTIINEGLSNPFALAFLLELNSRGLSSSSISRIIHEVSQTVGAMQSQPSLQMLFSRSITDQSIAEASIFPDFENLDQGQLEAIAYIAVSISLKFAEAMSRDTLSLYHEAACYLYTIGLAKITPNANLSGEASLPDDFIDSVYFLLNPDVMLAGLDARKHYISYGEKEGRRYNPFV